MGFKDDFKKAIFLINASNFKEISLKAFEYQALYNPIYKKFINYLNINPKHINSIDKIPFLPINFYKKHRIVSVNSKVETIFESSSTTNSIPSKHFVSDLAFYEKLCLYIFNSFYGNLENYHIFALLPNYLERSNSSLIYMVKTLMQATKQVNRFYKLDYKKLLSDIHDIQKTDKKIILFGVTFALLELAKYEGLDFKNITIIETGGMKGRGQERIREDLHTFLLNRFNPLSINSQYGMTELLSHTYTLDGYSFKPLPWFKVLLRDIYDPFEYVPSRGAINIIDLANIDTCCFIQTDDIGSKDTQNSTNFESCFQVLGRLDNTELRGCNLLF